MTLVSNTFSRDANRVPITTGGITSTSQATLIASNTTASNLLFGITGSIEVTRLYGIVTTVLSSNITAAFFRQNDQTAQVDISASSGTTLSSAAVGSVIMRKALAATALTFINSSAGRITESSAVNLMFPSPFVLTQKTAAVQTDVEFRYTTTNTPATGVIVFYMTWLPISSDAAVSPYNV